MVNGGVQSIRWENSRQSGWEAKDKDGLTRGITMVNERRKGRKGVYMSRPFHPPFSNHHPLWRTKYITRLTSSTKQCNMQFLGCMSVALPGARAVRATEHKVNRPAKTPDNMLLAGGDKLESSGTSNLFFHRPLNLQHTHWYLQSAMHQIYMLFTD